MSTPDINGWMPIETAPKDGTTVDLWAKVRNRDESARVADCSWGSMVDWHGEERDDWFGLYVGMHLSYENPTHWRPLPKPPVQP